MTVANNGAVPLVQLDPTNVSIAAIASGQYDSYLSAYAKAVRAYRRPVILSFGHEMNGYWYSWGYLHTPGGGIRGRLAAHRHPLPRAGSPERDLDVDDQHHPQASATFPPQAHGGPAARM